MARSLMVPAAVGATSSSATAPRRAGGTLVAYFSRSGSTRVIAGYIHRSRGADLIEIEPARPYPEDYFETVAQARRERDSGYEPPLKALVSGMANYAILLVGFPIWGEAAPPIIRSFLSAHDLSGKTVIPFITHGGYGLGNTMSVLRTHAPRARLVEGFSMEAPQEKQTVARVADWLSATPKLD